MEAAKQSMKNGYAVLSKQQQQQHYVTQDNIIATHNWYQYYQPPHYHGQVIQNIRYYTLQSQLNISERQTGMAGVRCAYLYNNKWYWAYHFIDILVWSRTTTVQYTSDNNMTVNEA